MYSQLIRSTGIASLVVFYGMLFSFGQQFDFEIIDPPGANSKNWNLASGINNHGQIVGSYIEAHGGSISAEVRHSGGAQFTIHFPLAHS